MKEFKVLLNCSGNIYVEADSKEDAIAKANNLTSADVRALLYPVSWDASEADEFIEAGNADE